MLIGRVSIDVGTAAAAGFGWPCIGADDGDGVDLVRVERKQIAVILQQGDALEGFLQCDCAAFLAESRNGGIGLVAIEEAKANGGAEDAADFLVDGGLGDLAALDGGQQVLRIHEFAGGHFEIEPAIGRADGGVGSVPVGHEDAVEFPVALEDVEIEVGVLRWRGRR